MSKKETKAGTSKNDKGLKIRNVEINPETIKDLNKVNDAIIRLNKKFENTIAEIFSLTVEKLLKELPYSDKVVEEKLKTGQISIGQLDNIYLRHPEPQLFVQYFSIREGNKINNFMIKIPMRSEHEDIMQAVTPKKETTNKEQKEAK